MKHTCILITLLSIYTAQGAIIIDNFSSATNDRFQNNDDPDQFFLAGNDFSGVGQDSNGRWATVIGPNTIISANHFKPSGTVSFYANNDLTGSPIQFNITTDTYRIGNGDLWLARLDGFVPSTIKQYDYATEAITESNIPVQPADFSFRGETGYMTGLSPSTFPADQDQAFGTNVFDDFVVRDVSGLGTDIGALEMNYDENATSYEAFFQTGDSGAPLFRTISGGLLLLGVNSYITTDSNGNPVASYASYTGNDSEEIDNQVALWAAVPEPRTTMFIVLGTLGVLVRRKRHSP